MLLKIDFHVHTDASKDGLDDVASVIRAAVRKSLDGLPTTDHNTMANVLTAEKLGRKNNLLVIKGEELRTKEGDVLIFGLHKPLPRGLSLNRAIILAKKQNAMVFVAHPYALMFHPLSSMGNTLLKYDVDGVEVFNSRTYIRNCKAMEIALKNDLCVIAGSDAHSADEIGNAYTLVDAETKSEQSVLHALQNHRTTITLNRTPVHKILRWYIKRVF